MKKTILKAIAIITILISVNACQEKIDVDLETSQERLVIEALLKWEKGTIGNEQYIKLSKTSSFYNNEIIPATGASVSITNKNTMQEFIFTDNNDGTYATSTFVPVVDDEYQLAINFNNEVYLSDEVLLPSPQITDITQSTESGFTVDDPEVNVFFQDFIGQDDYYQIVFDHYRPSINELIESDSFSYDARFEEDNLLSDWYEHEDLLPGDQIQVKIYKITEAYFTFSEVLNQQADSGIGPFSSPPVNVKGNCVNTSNANNYPYGYFSLNEVSVGDYVFE